MFSVQYNLKITSVILFSLLLIREGFKSNHVKAFCTLLAYFHLKNGKLVQYTALIYRGLNKFFSFGCNFPVVDWFLKQKVYSFNTLWYGLIHMVLTVVMRHVLVLLSGSC